MITELEKIGYKELQIDYSSTLEASEAINILSENFKKEDIPEAYEYISDLEVMKYIEKPFDYKSTERFIANYGTNENPLVYAFETMAIYYYLEYIQI